MTAQRPKQELKEDVEFLEVASMLVITMHNLAAEEEFFFNFDLALNYYQHAYKFANENLSDQNVLTEKMKEKLKDFKEVDIYKKKSDSVTEKINKYLKYVFFLSPLFTFIN